jgi:hypothetical protein
MTSTADSSELADTFSYSEARRQGVPERTLRRILRERPTCDVDLRADRLAATPEPGLNAISTIAARPVDDGLIFDAAGARAEVIRDEDEYSGVRVQMNVDLATARMVFHVDVNVGDPVIPHPRPVAVPRLNGGVVQVLGYRLT